ncbi:AraC family transcriptional regulator [Jiangella anatolica]|uniref:AraC family transcriptional regulator n=1 Tax=Jiangella anatolica TaxID=2670374 RepID=A0A2W2CJ08_9ACTN|nr:AraC family transcriptional regulator [Jiangella anatolica]PZF80213.1 AraC family transcriptional regulator [Jiangella anatolica]
MVDDQLSEVFDLVEVRGVVSGGFVSRGPWVTHAKIEGLKFFAVVSGRARLNADGLDEPLQLEEGDVAVLNDRAWLTAEGGSGDGPPQEVTPDADFSSFRLTSGFGAGADVVVGGHVDLDPAGRALLSQALPPVAHVRGSGAAAANLRGSLHRLLDELTERRVGSAFAVRQHGQLLLLEVLRAYVGQAELPPGWLRLLTDQRLRPALDLMHAEPGRRWGLAELARAAAMSRTSFAERFRGVAGVPPLTYLGRWRMLLAQRALRDDDVRVGSLASGLGYASESAFSTAFKREVGESPLRYRHRLRD